MSKKNESRNLFTGKFENTPTKKCYSAKPMMDDPPSWFNFYGNTTPAKQRLNVAKGRHPLGAPLNEDDNIICGDCDAVQIKKLANKYYKCSKHNDSNGPGTDLRLKWRACKLFVPSENFLRKNGITIKGKEEW